MTLACRPGVCAFVLVAACGGSSAPPDSGDTGTRFDVAQDVTRADTTAPTDAQSPDDVTVADATPSDNTVPTDATTDAASDARADAHVDAGRDATADASPCGSAMFCEPFDSYGTRSTIANNATFGPWRATLQTPGSTMQLDGTHTVSGSRALHVHIDNGVTAGGRLFSNGSLPILASHPTHIYGRMMMYIDPNGSSVHWTFFGVNGPAVAPATGRTASYLISSLPRSGVNTYSFVDGLSATSSNAYHDCWFQGTTPMPTATWTCLAFEMDSAGRHMRLTSNGAATPTLSQDDHGQGCVDPSIPDDSPWYGPMINQFYAGAWSFHAMTGPLDVWIDDVVLDTAPVTCPSR